MEKEQLLIKIDDKTDNIINFKDARTALLTGGTTIDDNWLKALPVGTVFLAKRKDQPKDVLVLDMYCVLEHKTVTSNLMQKIPDGRQADFWFRSLEFSRKNEWVETIAEVELVYDHSKSPEEETDEKEKEDGNSSGTV